MATRSSSPSIGPVTSSPGGPCGRCVQRNCPLPGDPHSRALPKAQMRAACAALPAPPHRRAGMVCKPKIKAMKKHTMPVVATVITSSKSSSTTTLAFFVGRSAKAPLGRRGGGTNPAAIAAPSPDCAAATTILGRCRRCRRATRKRAEPSDVLSIIRIGVGNLEGVEGRCDQIGRVDRLAVLFVG